MKITELKLKISQELMDKLEKEALTRGCTPNELVCSMISDKLNTADKKEDNSIFFPKVSLIKGNHQPEDLMPLAKANEATKHTINQVSAISNEKIAKKQALEKQMKELSLLVQTAESENKKENYLMQYANLAAELDALL